VGLSRYSVRGVSVATAATIDHAIAQIWNPSATKRIEVVEFAYFALTAPAASSGYYLRRSTARGTAGSTATPGLENSYARDAVPDSGFLLDLAVFTVQPTLAAAPGMGPGFGLSPVSGSGLFYPIPGIFLTIPPGTGLVLCNRAAAITPAGEIWVVVDD
jgi:hypothetical protein